MAEEASGSFEVFLEGLHFVEKELGLDHGFLIDLAHEDDWSFVIKAHALVEAAVSHQLASVLDPRLRPVFDGLELSDARAGKIAFARALELNSSKERRFIRRFSELRNSLVHDISRVSFTFREHVESLDHQQTKSLVEALTFFVTRPEKLDEWKQIARENTKVALLAGVVTMLSTATTTALSVKFEREMAELSIERAQLLERSFQET